MKKYTILIPVYNDWKSVFKLLKEIDFQVSKWNADVSILVMNDGSTEARPTNEFILKNLLAWSLEREVNTVGDTIITKNNIEPSNIEFKYERASNNIIFR